MKTPSPPEPIEARLKIVRARIRGVQRIRAVMIVTTVALAGLMAVMAVYFLLPPQPVWVRVALTAAWAIAVLAALRHGFGPMLKPIGLLEVARWLEVRHPEMEERLSTVLELQAQAGMVSPGLLDSLARAAEADLGTVDPGIEVKSARTSRRWAGPAIAALAVLAVVFTVWPGEASRLLVRAVAPFSSSGNAAAGKFRIKPGNIELVAGDPLRIEAVYTGSSRQLDVWMEMENDRKISQAMTRHDDGNFGYLMDPTRTGFRYRVRAGREESDGYVITVWPLPALDDARATLESPAYTGVPPHEVLAGRGIEAVVGTQVTIGGKLNTAVESAWLEIDGRKSADATVENAAGGGRLRVTWQLAAGSSGTAQIKLKHRLGREVMALEFPVQVLEDTAPEVVLLSPLQRDFKVRPDDLLPMKYEITEDYSVAKVAVEVDSGGNATTALNETLPPRIAGSKPPRFAGEAAVAIGALRSRFPGITEVRLRIRAEDSLPADSGGPGIGFSDWVTLHIDQGAESLARQELRQEHEGARKTIEEAMRSTREARERMDWHRGEIKKPELSENARKNLNESAERLSLAKEKLSELARQMKESVHAQKADEVEKAAESVAKAREELKDSQLQDDPDQREAKLDAAREDARETEKQLEQVRQAMDRDRSKVEDLARLMELAQRQQELARQAKAELTRADAPEKPADPWRNEQRQVEDRLKEQLRQRPEGKAEALKQQAEQATALAEQARHQADHQAMMEAQSKEPSPEALRQALGAQQAQIAKEVDAAVAQAQRDHTSVADSLPDAAHHAGQAKEKIDQGNLQAAATEAKTASQNLAEAAKPRQESPAGGEDTVDGAAASAALEKLADRQQQVAGALEHLAKGNTAEAMKSMAEAGAEQSAELAEAIAELPQLDGNGAVQDARNSGSKAGRQAERASEENQAGKLEQAAGQHGEAGKNFGEAAKSLERAGAEFIQGASELASHAPDPQRAPVSPTSLADAFQQASKAGSANAPADAAAHAAAAAKALAQAAESGRSQMQGKGPSGMSPGPPDGMPGEDGTGTRPGELPTNKFRTAEGDPGVPPELAKLGISSEDWAKIKASLKADVAAGEVDGVPAEYRGLVKGYFESMARTPDKK